MIIYYATITQKWCRKYDRLPMDDEKLRTKLDKLAEWCLTDMRRQYRGCRPL